MTSISDSATKLGSVNLDKDTGRIKITPKVNDVDIGGDVLKEIEKAKIAKLDLQLDKIDKNTQIITALEDFKDKLLNLDRIVSSLNNRFNLNSTNKTFNYLTKKKINPPSTDFGKLTVYDYAQTGNYSVRINQIASFDKYKSYIKATNQAIPANLNGSFILGNGQPSSQEEFTISPNQSLSDIIHLVNSKSSKTGVTAKIVQVTTSNTANTFELRFTSNATGTPIVLKDTGGTILADWNLLPSQLRSIQSTNVFSDPNAVLTTGSGYSFSFKAADGISYTFDTANKSLNDIANEINTSGSGANITASIIPIYASDALSSALPIGHKLRLDSNNNTAISFNGSDTKALELLKLPFPRTISASMAVDDPATPGITGNLKIQAGNNAEIVDINTAGLSLQDIADAINNTTETTKVGARLQLIQKANTSISDNKNIYQLTVFTTDTPASLINIDGSDPATLAGLGLNFPTSDYQSLISKATVDGTDFERTTNVITDIIPGVTMELTATSTTSSTIKVQESADEAYTQFTEGFITAYNELNVFYNKQTASNEDGSGAAEDAHLFDNIYIKGLMTDLRAATNKAIKVSTSHPTKAMSIINLGLDTVTEQGVDYGTLYIKPTVKGTDPANPNGALIEKSGLEALQNAFDTDFNSVIKLFTNTKTISNGKFDISYLPDMLHKQIAERDLTVTLSKSASGDLTATVSGVGIGSHTLDCVEGGGVIFITGKDGTPFKGVKFNYSGILNNGDSDQTTINITPGIMAAIDGIILDVTNTDTLPNSDPNSKKKTPFMIKGIFLQEIELFKDKNLQLKEEIREKKESIKKEMETMAREYDAVYAAQAKLHEIQMMLEQWSKAKGQ